jgi:hypothetical protein
MIEHGLRPIGEAQQSYAAPSSSAIDQTWFHRGGTWRDQCAAASAVVRGEKLTGLLNGFQVRNDRTERPGSRRRRCEDVLVALVPGGVVFLSRGLRVTQEFMHVADIGTAFEQFDGSRVTEAVRTALCDLGLYEYRLHIVRELPGNGPFLSLTRPEKIVRVAIRYGQQLDSRFRWNGIIDEDTSLQATPHIAILAAITAPLPTRVRHLVVPPIQLNGDLRLGLDVAVTGKQAASEMVEARSVVSEQASTGCVLDR